jgi:hypothetical protein
LSTTNPTGLTQARTQAVAVRGWRPTAWTMARPAGPSYTAGVTCPPKTVMLDTICFLLYRECDMSSKTVMLDIFSFLFYRGCDMSPKTVMLDTFCFLLYRECDMSPKTVMLDTFCFLLYSECDMSPQDCYVRYILFSLIPRVWHVPQDCYVRYILFSLIPRVLKLSSDTRGIKRAYLFWGLLINYSQLSSQTVLYTVNYEAEKPLLCSSN